jgi:hypothetical protein
MPPEPAVPVQPIQQTVQPVEPVVPVQPVHTEAPKKGGNNILLIIILIIILLAGAGASYYFLIYKQQSNNTVVNTTSTTTTITTTTTSAKSEYLTGKISLSDYCGDATDCNKEIGDVKIGNQVLSLSVNIKGINKSNKSGEIILGDNKLDVYWLSKPWPIIDGFEVYKDYLIVYLSSAEVDGDRDLVDCDIRGYAIEIFDINLNKIMTYTGYTLNNALKDFKIEDGYLYYYEMDRESMKYKKMKFDDFISDNSPEPEVISDIRSC